MKWAAVITGVFLGYVAIRARQVSAPKPTMTVNVEQNSNFEDFYASLVAQVEDGRLVAVIPAAHNGYMGTWSTSYKVEPGHIKGDESALMAAMLAINMTRRRARERGVLPL